MRGATRRLIAVAVLVGCGGDGSGGSGNGAVPTPVVPVSDAAATETASAAALSIVAALEALAAPPPGLDPAPPAEGVAQVAACLNGGGLAATCAQAGGRAIVRTHADQCELTDPASGGRVIVDGRLTATIAASGVCRSGQVPPAAERRYRLSDFRATTLVDGRTVESFATTRLRMVVAPQSGGCGGDADLHLDGRAVVTRSDGTDVVVDARGLRLAVRFAGEACARRIHADGVVAILDRGAGARQIDVDFEALQLDRALGGVRLDGAAIVRCVGRLQFESVEPIARDGACAERGALRLRLPSGAEARVGYAAGGLTLDRDGDGVPERSLETCLDLALACP